MSLLRHSMRIYRLFHTSTPVSAKKPTKSKLKSKAPSKPIHALLGRSSSKLSVGIVGLANVGKSTFFQSVTKSTLGNPNNYPFATVDPEEALYSVPSEKLNNLAKVYGSRKVFPSYLKIVDIAGLVRNASKGEGLGNQFLNDIRNVDGIFHVVRGFDDEEITHVELTVDPVRDMEIVSDELLLKDLETVEGVIERNKKGMKSAKATERKETERENEILERLSEIMMEKGRLLNHEEWTEEEVKVVNQHKFLTAKPTLYLLNVSKEDFMKGENKYLKDVQEWLKEHSPNEKVMMFSADLEHKFVESEHKSEAIDSMVKEMKSLLNLISFYTCGPMEAREWNVKLGSTAPEGAAMIHTDLQKGFLNVNVWKYDKVMGMKDQIVDGQVDKAVKFEKHGKAYEVQDGDVMLINAVGGKTR